MSARPGPTAAPPETEHIFRRLKILLSAGTKDCDTPRSFLSMNIASATFHCSAPDLDSCPDESLPEFAFIGRSNVGKSSLLNTLAGQAGLARVSTTPGFTKMINIFTMNKTWRLVDLPGYGYAHVARKDSARFNQAVLHYLNRRPNLCCVFTLIDSNLPPQAIDIEFVRWLAANSVPFALVFTKTDRGTPAGARANMEAFTGEISGWFQMLPEIFTSSATTGRGRTELLAMIQRSMKAERSEAQADPEPSSHDAGVPPEDAPPARPKPAPVARRKRPNPARPW